MAVADKYASVCIEISHEKVDRPFQYRIPGELKDKVYPGVKVRVPFGKGNKDIAGFVMDVTDEPVFDADKTKDILSVSEEAVGVEGRMIALAAWIRRHYGSTMIAALKTVLPVKSKVKAVSEKEIRLLSDENALKELKEEAERKHHVAKMRLFEAFEEADALSYSFVTGKLNVSPATLSSLNKNGIIEIKEYKTYRNPVKIKSSVRKKAVLNTAQQAAFDIFKEEYDKGERNTYLVHGITGSGKTELYMEMIDRVLADGKEVIVLIPEIALTYQTVMRFYARFGDVISVMHSKLSVGERFDQFERAKNGDIKIMIGPRSALFTPFNNIGLIVMDEEHEGSYKSDRPPKYHARETAAEVAKMHGATFVMGSATPSVTAYARALSGEYRLLTLNERYSDAVIPDVEICDLREELKSGNKSIFSNSLKRRLAEVLDKKEQAILFLNRRGYAGFISCRSCGYVAKCPHCDVSLTEHGRTKLVCHYCGYEEPRPKVCPSCGSKYIAGFSAGTEQVEEKLKEMLPTARVLRMDADTTKKKDDYERILSSFAEGEADILIGTQMIVKGHDFPNVTLVGILAADLSLFAGDYMASERTFELLTQAIGRAGRGSKKGHAILQTYKPEHYAIQRSVKQDYKGFFNEEFAYRKMCSYPPVSHMLAILMTGKDANKLGNFALKIKKAAATDDMLRIIGPADAFISKIDDRYRKVIYIRSADEEALIKAKERVEEMTDELRKVNDPDYIASTYVFDFDPINVY